MSAAAVGVLALFWTWGHPTAFEPYSTSKVWTNRAYVGQTVYVGMTFEGLADTRQVTVRDVTVHGVAEGSEADFDYLLCTVNPGQGGVGLAFEADLADLCASLGPAKGADMKLGKQQLLLAITPTQPGRVLMHGLDVKYTDGWRTGTQHVGLVARVGRTSDK